MSTKKSNLSSKNFHDRLKQIVGKPYPFSKRVGILEQTIRKWTTESAWPRTDMVIKICQDLDISADWLLLGKDNTVEVSDDYLQKMKAMENIINRYEKDIGRYIKELDRKDREIDKLLVRISELEKDITRPFQSRRMAEKKEEI